jgi:NitT/TauT family transport system substrate-binding protein
MVLLVTVMLLSCQNSNEILPVLRLGHAPHDHHSPLYIAAMNPDYFKENGGIYLKEITYQKEYQLFSGSRDLARVVVDSSTGGKELIRKLSEEYFDISFGGFPAMLHFIDQGSPIKILAPIMTEGAGLLVANDLPVSNWEEFVAYAQQRSNPLKIGYKTAVSVQNLIFEHALQESIVPYATSTSDPNAKIIGLNLHGPKNLIPALENGLIDGFVIMQPYLALAEEKGIGKTITMLSDMPPHGKWKGIPCCALATNNHFAQSHPEVAEAILTLILRANQFIVKNPAESATLVSRWLQVPESVEKKALSTIIFTTDYTVTWSNGVDFWTHSMIQSGRLKSKIKKAYEEGRLEQEIYNRNLYDKAREQL